MGRYRAHQPRRTWQKIAGVAAIVIILGVIVSALTVRHIYTENLQPVSASQKSQLVTIKTGSTVKQVAAQLESQGLIRKAWAFEAYIRTKNLRDKVQAGSYLLRPNQSVSEIAKVLTRGEIATDSITILPAQRLDQVRKAFIASGFSSDAVDAALDPKLYADHPALADKPSSASLEGYLYPDTFQKTTDTKPEAIIRASLDEMQRYLTPEIREGIVRQGLTVHQGIILASVVEQEVSNPADKPIVAQVFLKRYKENIALGSDVTAVYGAVAAGHDDYSVGEAIGFDSPYNTRIHSGMPPGPISNVGKASLQAIANPAQTDYLFFVAGDDGKTYFSKTQAEHDANIAAHCKKLCSL